MMSCTPRLALSLLLGLASFCTVDGSLAVRVAGASLTLREDKGMKAAGGQDKEEDEDKKKDDEDKDEDEDDDEKGSDAAEKVDDDDGEAQEERQEDLQEAPEAFMQEADLNQDGKISLKELYQVINRDVKIEQGPLNVSGAEVKLLETDVAHFHAAADRNKDGLVDVKELPVMLQLMDEEQNVARDAVQEHVAGQLQASGPPVAAGRQYVNNEV